MMVSDDTREFLENNRDIINSGDIRTLYDHDHLRALHIFAGTISEITQLMYKIGIDPLNYLYEIPEYFLMGSKIKTFTIPNHITTIYRGAFRDCELLESIIIPDKIDTIGLGAFANCKSLKKLKLPESLEVVPKLMCSNCSKLSEVDIPSNVSEIGSVAFFGTAIKKVKLSNNLNFIDTNAFPRNLEEVEFDGNMFYWKGLMYAAASPNIGLHNAIIKCRDGILKYVNKNWIEIN